MTEQWGLYQRYQKPKLEKVLRPQPHRINANVPNANVSSRFSQVAEQWGLYDGYDPRLEKVLRYRRRTGRHMPIMNVIPPGLDFSNLKVRRKSTEHLKFTLAIWEICSCGMQGQGGTPCSRRIQTLRRRAAVTAPCRPCRCKPIQAVAAAAAEKLLCLHTSRKRAGVQGWIHVGHSLCSWLF